MTHTLNRQIHQREIPGLVKNCEGAYISMGLTAENVARKYEISRREMDEMAVESHRRAAKHRTTVI